MATVIHWFRQDLRLTDNPALSAAVKVGDVLPVYILDDENAGDHVLEGAGRWWLHYSLTALDKSLNGKLAVYYGNPEKILPELVAAHDVSGIYWNRCYEPWRVKRDKRIKSHFADTDVVVKSFNGSLLWEPWEVLKSDQTPYKVFTPYYRKGCLQADPPRKPLPKPQSAKYITDASNAIKIADLELLPKIGWDKQLEPHWHIGEKSALKRLKTFIKDGLHGYKQGRNFPTQDNVSRLSPHLHFGEISPNQAWYAALSEIPSDDVDCFCSELAWREFSYNLLYYFPELPHKNMQSKFDNFPWRKDVKSLKRWQTGLTGYPIVDAGMRELWQTGYMHNRVRMVVGSFLIKNLLLHWRHGEKWFWDCLVDADLANNSASWQWVAGSGADAAPYFRIFNPVTQGQKFDPDGSYIKQYVPELAALPDKYLSCPWEASTDVLKEAGIELGNDYPKPIVDLRASRERALEAFKSLKVANQ